jgi:hypothetical protein
MNQRGKMGYEAVNEGNQDFEGFEGINLDFGLFRIRA